MKLIIQIPCFNEADQLEATVNDLPRKIPGIDEIQLLIIDDGSVDGTFEKAEFLGAHHILRFPQNRGLAAAHSAGLEACLRLGADVVVNTDADNQYKGNDIAKLVRPILENQADIVIGDRNTDTIEEFSPLKKVLQKWGSSLVRYASGTSVKDAASGFRAMSRRAISHLVVHNKFSYTLETIIQAGRLGLAIENVQIEVNPETRPSRLSSSMFDYLRRNGPVILRSYSLYWPVQTFGFLALILLLFGLFLGGRFLYYYFEDPAVSSHVQSLLVGVGSIVLAFIVGLMAILGDLLSLNRRLLEETINKVRFIEAHLSKQEQNPVSPNNLYRTSHKSW